MKKLFSFLTIISIILASNCSRIPENNDPVIGVWSKIDKSNLSESESKSIRQEWIFNDAYLGRYHSYENKALEVKTDFKWVRDKEAYLISYPGTDIPDHKVLLQETETGMLLKDVNGTIFAIRE